MNNLLEAAEFLAKHAEKCGTASSHARLCTSEIGMGKEFAGMRLANAPRRSLG